MIQENNIEEYIINFWDEELSEEEVLLLHQYLEQHPHFLDLYKSYEPLRMESDKSILYEHKSELCQKEQRAFVLPIYAKVAAVAGLVSLSLWTVVDWKGKSIVEAGGVEVAVTQNDLSAKEEEEMNEKYTAKATSQTVAQQVSITNTNKVIVRTRKRKKISPKAVARLRIVNNDPLATAKQEMTKHNKLEAIALDGQKPRVNVKVIHHVALVPIQQIEYEHESLIQLPVSESFDERIYAFSSAFQEMKQEWKDNLLIQDFKTKINKSLNHFK